MSQITGPSMQVRAEPTQRRINRFRLFRQRKNSDCPIRRRQPVTTAANAMVSSAFSGSGLHASPRVAHFHLWIAAPASSGSRVQIRITRRGPVLARRAIPRPADLLESCAQLDFFQSPQPACSAGERRCEIEPFYTLKEAAKCLNLKYWHLLRMSKRGELRLYRAGSGRNRVLLSEVMQAIRGCPEQEPSVDGGSATDLAEAGRA